MYDFLHRSTHIFVENKCSYMLCVLHKVANKCYFCKSKYVNTMKTGDRLPDVLGIDANGNEVRLSDYVGRKIVLYFYPKDNTPGCTAEACSLRDGYEALREAGYEVIGVSKDSPASHRKFADKHNLPFTLIADTETTLNQALGVWREKKMAGRTYMGTVRTTFIADEQGVITHVIEKVTTADHARQILQLVNNK